MTSTIHYYFTSLSPWAYLGHAALLDVARRNGAEVAFKPVMLGEVWAVSGSVPLARRSPTRQRYRNIELQRYGELRGLPINLKPKFFPTDPTLADHVVIALVKQGKSPAGFMARVFAGLWAEEEDIADRATLARYLAEEEINPEPVLAAAESPDAAVTRQRNSEEAIAADAIGVPAYVLNGEVFWGQDRIDLLDRALATGRQPYRA